jgi:hypothetical protein
MELELMIIVHTDESAKLADMEIEVPVETLPTELYTFYKVEYLKPCENPKLCVIGTNCDEFIVKESYASVKQKIKDQMVFKFN